MASVRTIYSTQSEATKVGGMYYKALLDVYETFISPRESQCLSLNFDLSLMCESPHSDGNGEETWCNYDILISSRYSNSYRVIKVVLVSKY